MKKIMLLRNHISYCRHTSCNLYCGLLQHSLVKIYPNIQQTPQKKKKRHLKYRMNKCVSAHPLFQSYFVALQLFLAKNYVCSRVT